VSWQCNNEENLRVDDPRFEQGLKFNSFVTTGIYEMKLGNRPDGAAERHELLLSHARFASTF
jgi:hypothetical protein